MKEHEMSDLRDMLHRAATVPNDDVVDITGLQRRANRRTRGRATVAAVAVVALAWGVAQPLLRVPDVALVGPPAPGAAAAPPAAASRGDDITGRVRVRPWRDDFCVGLSGGG